MTWPAWWPPSARRPPSWTWPAGPAAFLRWDDFDKSARLASHSARGVIELMPVSDGIQYAFKYVNGHPRNAQHGMPTVMACGLLAEVETGFPLMLADLTLATALRTAATSALAARAMARPGAATMALIGNGAQAEFQVLAFQAMLGVREIAAYDIDPAATTRLMRNLGGVPGLSIRAPNRSRPRWPGRTLSPR